MSDQPNPSSSPFTDLSGMPDLSWVTGMQDQLRDDADMGAHRLDGYRLQQDYYDGEHNVPLKDRERRYLEINGVPFCENFHETIVDVHADLSQLESVQFHGRDALTEWANGPVWAHSNLDAVQAQIGHTQCLKGDAFVVVSFDDETGLPVFEYNRPEQIKPVYDDEGVLYFVKVWDTSRTSPTNPSGKPLRRMNRYFPERVEKWFTLASDSTEGDAEWLPHLDDDDLDQHELTAIPAEDDDPGLESETVLVDVARWPTWWTETGEPDGEPIGLNVFHFRNKALDGMWGRPVGKGWVPFQNELNKQLLDLFQVMDTQGWKQRWAAGVTEGDSLAVAIGEWVSTSAPDAKFGEFGAEDPRPLLEAIESTLRRGAAKTQTPLHMLMLAGTLPSGESLKTAESPAVRTAKARNTFSIPTWVDCWKMGVKLTEIFGTLPTEDAGEDDDLVPEVRLIVTPVFADPQSRNEKSEAETFESHHRLGVSKRTLQGKLGYDPEEEAENRREEDAEALEVAARAFDQGDVEPVPDAEGDPRDGGGHDLPNT